MEIGLFQRQKLNIMMTQELQQVIAILQYSTQELIGFLEMKAMENPLIKLESPKSDDDIRNKKSVHREDDKNKWLEQLAEKPGNLAEYLLEQLIMESLSKVERKLLTQIIYNIDMNGYLKISSEEIAAMNKVELDIVHKYVDIVQSLDPPGIGARSLQECLLLQVRRQKEIPTLVTSLLTDYFQEFADKKWRFLAAELQVSLSEIQKAADIIVQLDPRPGSHFYEEPPQYVTPDLILEIVDGQMKLQVCDKYLPALNYESTYYSQMMSYGDKLVNQFLHEKKQDFLWIMNSLEQRRLTLIKVGSAIIEEQQEFFLKGPSYLKPLIMREIAQKLDIHESTVSRAVREKYVQTPTGIYDLKSLFTQALPVNNEEASANQVKIMIEEMVDKENKSKPLSDQQITDQLQSRGMGISRRTVAKYRDQLRIPSSTKRKRYV